MNDHTEAQTFLEGVMRGEITPTVSQLDAAKALLRGHSAAPKGGIKAAKVDSAREIAAGDRFAPGAPPKLIVNNG